MVLQKLLQIRMRNCCQFPAAFTDSKVHWPVVPTRKRQSPQTQPHSRVCTAGCRLMELSSVAIMESSVCRARYKRDSDSAREPATYPHCQRSWDRFFENVKHWFVLVQIYRQLRIERAETMSHRPCKTPRATIAGLRARIPGAQIPTGPAWRARTSPPPGPGVVRSDP